ncbi:hypothetical protein PSMK_22340 [Phycisphaera mikurensis NBRC 102666]|uniref:Methanolan biosynthesis EpsI domain-containing protein n=1 Tax=Phycisphaera mikurensis (strain NBRC 102666 / KCTC 22515 / FYK2301M01) TaxID=1142394 RepID=I0IGK5_PHYMF|nr:hypothetical protein PSMK_22340 [Phycisphaera mikurensis NBRC 102666]
MGGLLAAGWFFWAFLRYSARAAIEDPNWSHILVVPVISAYYVFLHHAKLAQMPARVCWWGLGVAFVGLFSYVWWIYPGRNDMFRGFSMILCLFGCVWFVQGTRRMRLLWFPVCYLLLAVKIPDSIWQQIAFQLQQIASAGSEVTLTIAGALLDFRLLADGQDFVMTWFNGSTYEEARFSIAEACSGLRMLMAFVALGVALAFLWDRFWWQRLIMVSMAIPIALVVNIGRVTVLGLLNLWDPELARGDAHIMVGMLMLLPAGAMFLGLGWVLDKIIIVEETPGGHADPVAAPPDRPAAAGASPGRVLVYLAGGGALAGLAGAAYLAGLDAVAAVDLVPWLAPAAAGVASVALLVGVAVLVVLLRRGGPRWVGALAVLTGVFAVASVALSSVVAATETVLIKEEVGMRHELVLLPKNIGPWAFVRDQPPLDKDRQDELGTDEYITRTYRDTRLAEDDAAAYAQVHIAYYSGMIDTVPHVPDRCWVAAGMLPGPIEVVTVGLDRRDASADPSNDAEVRVPVQLVDPTRPDEPGFARLPGLEVPATRFTAFESERPDEPLTATYFFVANGGFFATPNQVRLQGFNLRDKYSYYCKVEVMMPFLRDAEKAKAGTADLLSHLLPEVMAALPDWTDVRAGRWPASEDPPALTAAATPAAGEPARADDPAPPAS